MSTMPLPVLATKLYIPPPGVRTISRPRLIERLDQGEQYKLTLVSAPAGFGKTTLVSTWIAGQNHPVAWVSLDEADSDPARFMRYVVTALQSVIPEFSAACWMRSSRPSHPRHRHS